jgi:hypothetical protein
MLMRLNPVSRHAAAFSVEMFEQAGRPAAKIYRVDHGFRDISYSFFMK